MQQNNRHTAKTTRLPFTKMHGIGNDYIYLNCFERDIPQPEALARALSDRHFGIGGDGLVLICPSGIADAKMRMFNHDGSEGLMCGNAIRCVGKYLYDNKIVAREDISIETLSGIKRLQLGLKDGVVDSVTVNMGMPGLSPQKVPVLLPGDSVVSRPVTIAGDEYSITCVSMGNPHCVVFCESPESLALEQIGPLFEYAAIFPKRVNTEFVAVESANSLRMRVWERGSGETLACGTGACAAACAAVENGFCTKGSDITVKLRGGQLIIRFTDEGIFMTGYARKVFDGVIDNVV